MDFLVMEKIISKIIASIRYLYKNKKEMDKQLVKITESDLYRMVESAVKELLSEEIGIDDDHTYSEQEMQWLYNNQDKLTPMQEKVLRAGMWVRARNANYHGYDKKWPNIVVKNNEIFYFEKNGELNRIPR